MAVERLSFTDGKRSKRERLSYQRWRGASSATGGSGRPRDGGRSWGPKTENAGTTRTASRAMKGGKRWLEWPWPAARYW